MTLLWYNVTRALARFFVASAAGTLLKAVEKYEPRWAAFTVLALLLAVTIFSIEQHIKSAQAL